jgi:hypothetical protein
MGVRDEASEGGGPAGVPVSDRLVVESQHSLGSLSVAYPCRRVVEVVAEVGADDDERIRGQGGEEVCAGRGVGAADCDREHTQAGSAATLEEGKLDLECVVGSVRRRIDCRVGAGRHGTKLVVDLDLADGRVPALGVRDCRSAEGREVGRPEQGDAEH